MATSSCDKRSFRPFLIVTLPILLVICIGGIIFTVAFTGTPFPAAPLVMVALALLRPIRWAMYWESSPTERQVLGKNLEREPILYLAMAWLRDYGRKTSKSAEKDKAVDHPRNPGDQGPDSFSAT